MCAELCPASRECLPAPVTAALCERGFVREGGRYRLEDLSFAARGRWFVLSEQPNGQEEWNWSQGMGKPSLWKWVPNGSRPHREFEVPSWAVSNLEEEDSLDEFGPAAFGRVLDWALETRCGRVPASWQSPDPDLVRSWMKPGALTLVSRGSVRQAELVLRPGCWALRVPILSELAVDLPPTRHRALVRLVGETQRSWAMVRIGVSPEASPAPLLLEVDLSGAPHCELLFSAGLDVLRPAARLAEIVEVLGNSAVEITCLKPDANNNPTEQKGKTP